MGKNRGFGDKQLLTEVALVSLCENVGHLLVLSQFSWRKEFLVAKVALEARLLPTVEFGAVVEKTKFRAHVLDGSAFEANIHL